MLRRRIHAQHREVIAEKGEGESGSDSDGEGCSRDIQIYDSTSRRRRLHRIVNFE